MPESTQQAPEPQWPTWVRRSDLWEPYDVLKPGCPCVTLEVIWEQYDIHGAVVVRLGRCLSCGVKWDWFAR